MSEDQMSEDQGCTADAAPYVLGALTSNEAERFEHHLRSCSICQEEVDSLGELTAALAVSVDPLPAHRNLRRAVMSEVRADARATRREQAPKRRWLAPGWLSGPGSRQPLSAGLLAVTLIVTAVAVLSVQRISSDSSKTRTFPAALGSAEVRVTDDRAELVIRHLPHLRGNQVYEVWLRRGKQPPRPTRALFEVSRAGTGVIQVPGTVDHVDELLVTEEPAGGSAVPTSDPVVIAQLD